MSHGQRMWLLVVLVPFLFTVGLAGKASSHCEIPCGIYDDQARIAMIAEDIKTIEKSMIKIVELSSKKDPNLNQIVRWVQNKETHANRIAEVITQYFLTQRVKPADKENPQKHSAYLTQLQLLHAMLLHSMKAKQTTDPAHVETLRTLLIKFNEIKDKKVRQQIEKLTAGYKNKAQFFVDKLAMGIGIIAAAFYPKDVILRFSDFKTNEYSNLIGGSAFDY